MGCDITPQFERGGREEAAHRVLERTFGKEHSERFVFEGGGTGDEGICKIHVEGDQVIVEGASTTSLCRGAYQFLRDQNYGIVSWSGVRMQMPERLAMYSDSLISPFRYRYYFNSVTHGYSTPYWDWSRWEKELDWMALHGMNMPLIGGAHEAILLRVFRELGLTEEEALDYFSGPAHFPWNRMGNIAGWDGPPPLSFFSKQIALTHKMLERMRELEMYPIIHAFAGFVPDGIKRIYPHEQLRELGWGGFDEKVQILSPNSELFVKIGKMYIETWEREFGKGAFYLADSFNEMDVPLSDDPAIANGELAAFGEAVYRPIVEANPDAVWVIQGWTFPYHRDKNGNLFWTPERLQAMISKIPDDKLLILDMANEYNALFWKIDYSWKMYNGFFGKHWVYSFIPNMGGKVPLNGVLDFYAKAPAKAINFESKKNLVGFGFAPEGIENNEIIYELLSDWGWQTEPIDLTKWIAEYCLSRYGAYPNELESAYDLLLKSSFGTFTDHPRFKFQFRPGEGTPTVHSSETFKKAVKMFLSAEKQLGHEALYRYDAIELAGQYIGLRIDEKLSEAENSKDEAESIEKYRSAIDLMYQLDRLLASHPLHKLSNWVVLARNFGDREQEKNYYESNAKRLITTWGGGVNEYSARMWSGLIGEYYAQRWDMWVSSIEKHVQFEILQWEEAWIKSPYMSEPVPFADPLQKASEMLE